MNEHRKATTLSWLLAVVVALTTFLGGCKKFDYQSALVVQLNYAATEAHTIEMNTGTLPNAFSEIVAVSNSLKESDPWGNAICILKTDDSGSIVIRSNGEDGKASTPDDSWIRVHPVQLDVSHKVERGLIVESGER